MALLSERWLHSPTSLSLLVRPWAPTSIQTAQPQSAGTPSLGIPTDSSAILLLSPSAALYAKPCLPESAHLPGLWNTVSLAPPLLLQVRLLISFQLGLPTRHCTACGPRPSSLPSPVSHGGISSKLVASAATYKPAIPEVISQPEPLDLCFQLSPLSFHLAFPMAAQT